MAFLTKNVFGDISGRVGNTVVRHRYGKEVVYSMPVNTNISYTDKAVAGRNKFANTIKLARLVNSNQDLSAIWKSAKIKGTNAYQKIIKHNASFTTPEGITVNNIISPPGFEVSTSSITIDEDSIKIESELDINSNFSSADLFILFTATNKIDSKLFLISSPASFIDVTKVQCKIQFDENQLKVFSSFGNAVILLAYIFKDSLSKIIGWTSTSSLFLDFTTRK